MMLKWIARILMAAAVLAICIGLWKREEITRLMAVQSLFSQDKIVHNFSHMDAAFLSTTLPRAIDDPSPLITGPTAVMPAQIADWVTDRSVTSLVVLKDAALVFEDYYRDTNPLDLRINWSVSKSYLSVLFGILLDEGAIGSIDEQVTQYVPDLVGSAYDGVSIKDVLQMSSGVVFNEDYLDSGSDINKMGRVLALGGSMDAFAAALIETDAEPGAQWRYVSIDTHVIGMVIRGATGRSVAELMNEKVIGRLGLEADPYYLTDGFDVAFALGGLNTTTRDNARFGQMTAQGGMWEGQQIVPTAWIDESTAPSANTIDGATGYGYQWWVPAGSTQGQFLARGIYGQFIYIDHGRNVVIASHGADRAFRTAGAFDQTMETFRAIAESLE